MQHIKYIIAVLFALLLTQGYMIYSLNKDVASLQSFQASSTPLLVEAYNGQNFIGTALYKIGVFDKSADGNGVTINPSLPLRSQP